MNEKLMVLKMMLDMFVGAVKFSAVVGFAVITIDAVYTKATKGVWY